MKSLIEHDISRSVR